MTWDRMYGVLPTREAHLSLGVQGFYLASACGHAGLPGGWPFDSWWKWFSMAQSPHHTSQCKLTWTQGPRWTKLFILGRTLKQLRDHFPGAEGKGQGLSLSSESRSAMSDSLQHHGLYSPWNSPGQNTGVGSLSLLHGIFPTQGSNPGFPHCGWILYQ